MDGSEHPFESRLVSEAEEDEQSMPQSQLLDRGIYADKTIPEFDEQDYTSEFVPGTSLCMCDTVFTFLSDIVAVSV